MMVKLVLAVTMPISMGCMSAFSGGSVLSEAEAEQTLSEFLNDWPTDWTGVFVWACDPDRPDPLWVISDLILFISLSPLIVLMHVCWFMNSEKLDVLLQWLRIGLFIKIMFVHTLKFGLFKWFSACIWKNVF